MPLNKDAADKESLRAHHLLHRSCRGKSHGNGIAKQSNRRATISLPATRFRKDRDPGTYETAGVATKASSKRVSRNGTSSWECSDSDSMHSSEAGQGAFIGMNGNGTRSPGANVPNRGENRPPSGPTSREKGNRSGHASPGSLKANGKSTRKKETWADTLRVRSIDDRIKQMEEGWDDSSVIRTPRERKWMRITAEIEQRTPGSESADFRLLELRGSSLKGWGNGTQKRNRKNAGSRGDAKPIVDIVEWEVLVEMALAKKIGRGKGRGRRDRGEDAVDEGVHRRPEVESTKGDAECMKRLEVLLQNRLPPQTVEVCHYRHTFGTENSRGCPSPGACKRV